MSASNPGRVRRFFRGAWRFVDVSRRVVLNLLFLLIVLAVILALAKNGPQPLADKTALVLLGWLAARWRALPESAIPGLNVYVLFFALPCLLFRFGSSGATRTPRPGASSTRPSFFSSRSACSTGWRLTANCAAKSSCVMRALGASAPVLMASSSAR